MRLTFDRTMEDARTLEPVLDKANASSARSVRRGQVSGHHDRERNEEGALSGEDSGVNLIHLADHENSVVVRVLGRHTPGVLLGHDWLNAEVIVASSFATGRRAFLLFPEDLASWAAVLDALAGGQDVLWLDDGHTPEFRVELTSQFECPAITVEDTSGCGVSVCVPVDVPDGWIDDLRSRLQQVLQTWPSEVEKTGPGVYQWRSR